MTNIVLSPYFTRNTQVVANFCRKCYKEEEEVRIIAVNVKFLKNIDLKYYHVVQNNFCFVQDSKPENSSPNENSNDPMLQNKGNFNQNQNSKKIQGQHFSIVKLEQEDFEIKEKSVEKEIVNKTIKVEQKNTTTQLKDNVIIEKTLGLCEFQHDIKNIVTPKWIPPISPHNLIEEKYYNDPWALLVVTIFLNKTSCMLALPYMDKFFEDFNGPYDVLKVEVEDLEPFFTKIGLVKTRATQVWRMSFDYVHKEWKNVGELFGVGKYAEDAYRMFHLGDFSIQPTDRYLKIYKAWYQMREKQEKLGVVDSNSQVYLEDYYVDLEDEDRTEDLSN